MGLLDEAIRQHLELKRQHGASDEELQLQEQEALGPVRREAAEPAAASAEDPELAPEPALESDAEPIYDEPVYDEPVYGEAPIEPGADAPPYEEPAAEGVEEAPFEAPVEEFHEPIDPFEEPVPAEADAATETLSPEEGFEPEPGGDTPSRGFDAVPEPAPEDAVPGDDGEEGDDDVLEETPEFLQETPEHDRLWFEQKPPRDFDFDE